MNQRDDLTRYVLKQFGLPHDDSAVKKTVAVWWQNPRKKDRGGLRLTEQGYNCIKKADIKDYEIQLPKETEWTSQLIIHLDQFIDCPFYITKKYIYVFSERMAVQLVLFSGNIQKYGLAKAKSLQKNNTESH
jgi:hypothetical protein